MEDFTNAVILPDNLPEIQQEQFNSLSKNYLKIILFRIAIFAIVLTAGVLAFIFFAGKEAPFFVKLILVCVISVLLIYVVVITILGFAKKGYLVREKDISFKRGLIAYKQTSVPFNRIQHVEVNQGVFEKIYNLSSLKIYTAGGTSSDLTIPGIAIETAHNLKAFLSEKISEHE
jgi:membrane protein YdbS with pleckstrin-like domain